MTNLPVTGKFGITAVFGQTGKYWSTFHKGIDFVCDVKNVYSTCDGTVRVVEYDEGGWGNYVSIGDDRGLRHIFCHLDKVNVSVGDKVTRSTVIGVMGMTGNATGVHLHYELHTSDNTVLDPSEYLGIPNITGNYDSVDFTVVTGYSDEKDISSWAKSAVSKVTELGIMVGDEKGRFLPKSNLTREQAAVIIMKILERNK